MTIYYFGDSSELKTSNYYYDINIIPIAGDVIVRYDFVSYKTYLVLFSKNKKYNILLLLLLDDGTIYNWNCDTGFYMKKQ